MEHLLENNPKMESFLEALHQLPDSRDNRGKRHSLVFIIVAVILAILVGRSMTSSLQRYIKNKIVWLRQITGIPDAKPISRAHLPRLLDQIAWQALNELMKQYFDIHLFPNPTDNVWIAIDGKVLRGSLKAGEKQAIVHAVTHDNAIEISQARQSGDKSSEIPVVRELLKETGLDTKKVSLDAHHCNPETTAQIASAGGKYLVQVKENQPLLMEQCRNLAAQEQSIFTFEQHEKGHGRLTSRYTQVYSMENVPLDSRWKASDQQTLVVIKRHTLTLKTGKEAEETSYYVSNKRLSCNDKEPARELVNAIRNHWTVESNNWVLDVTFNEDKVRIKAKNQSHIMASLRGFAIQLLRKAGVQNFQAALEEFADSSEVMELMLRQVKFL